MKHVNSEDLGHHKKNDINYKWVKLNAFVRWYASSKECPNGRTEIVLFDHPEFAQEVGDFIIHELKPRELGDPFWAYPAMVEKVAALHDVCVWESRTLIRNYEKQRTQYRDPFDYLHEVSRHSLHINETLHVAESILDSMQKYHDHFTATELNSDEKVDRFDPFPQNIKNRLGLLQTTLTHLRHRAESNHERVKAEISLSFNKSAQIESGATRTISLAGLLFLPAAYITALFSTSFFNYDAPTGIWGFSHKFWIYWAVTIPVTALTIFLWFFGAMIWGVVLNCCTDIHALFQGSVALADPPPFFGSMIEWYSVALEDFGAAPSRLGIWIADEESSQVPLLSKIPDTPPPLRAMDSASASARYAPDPSRIFTMRVSD
ncbi:hypothetical protein MKX08_004172 [Trichoderma sp. CBMAI-0020]|nr:hypothetical protein MKX08_004172 [Trichoderma sp. CBMAI-0020]